jgi:excisionase family DNA binding protein
MSASKEPPRPSEGLLTTAEAADRLSISLRSLQAIIATGEIPIVRIGRRVAIDPRDLDAFVRARREGGALRR